VNRVGDQLLTSARFTSQEDRCGRRGNQGDLRAHVTHLGAGPDQSREIVAFLQLLTEVEILLTQRDPLLVGRLVVLTAWASCVRT
jgi:hypothetical protein